MITVTGVIASAAPARRIMYELEAIGVPRARISWLAPGASADDLRSVPTTDAEPPGVGAALGAVVGGAAGAAGGAAVAALLLPVAGPVIVLGALATAIAGAAAGGAAALELEAGLAHGLPKDELYVYADALRQGRSIVIVLAEDGAQAEAVREVMVRERAESVDAARERWWLGLRDAEEEHYTRGGGDFTQDESRYRRGFDAAFRLSALDRNLDDAMLVGPLRERHGTDAADPVFRAGYERGLARAREQRFRAPAPEPTQRRR